MNVAFDLDGTISAYPALCESIASSLVAAGHMVVVLTGHADKNPESCNRDEVTAKKKSLTEAVGFKSFSRFVCCIVRNSQEAAAFKAGYCFGEKIDVLIDDAPDYCEAVKRQCPNMLVLHVHEKGDKK